MKSIVIFGVDYLEENNLQLDVRQIYKKSDTHTLVKKIISDNSFKTEDLLILKAYVSQKINIANKIINYFSSTSNLILIFSIIYFFYQSIVYMLEVSNNGMLSSMGRFPLLVKFIIINANKLKGFLSVLLMFFLAVIIQLISSMISLNMKKISLLKADAVLLAIDFKLNKQ